MRTARFAIVVSALLFLAIAEAASAAVRPVDIAGFKFEPQSVTITVGDTVTWTNKDTFQHSARVAGVGTTPTLSQGQSGSLQFMTAGTFSYDCGIHGSSMTGTVIARAAATAPPTQAPTQVPTARPTVAPTPVSTPVPTVATTVPPTPTPSPSPTASAAATAAASATAAPTVAVAVPTQQAPAPAGEYIDLTALALIAVAVMLLIPVAAAGLRRFRGR